MHVIRATLNRRQFSNKKCVVHSRSPHIPCILHLTHQPDWVSSHALPVSLAYCGRPHSSRDLNSPPISLIHFLPVPYPISLALQRCSNPQLHVIAHTCMSCTRTGAARSGRRADVQRDPVHVLRVCPRPCLMRHHCSPFSSAPNNPDRPLTMAAMFRKRWADMVDDDEDKVIARDISLKPCRCHDDTSIVIIMLRTCALRRRTRPS